MHKQKVKSYALLRETGPGRQYLTVFLTALVLSAIIYLPFLIIDKGIFVYYGDYNVQQIPFYQMCHDMIRSGEVGWNWYTDLGSNFVGSYAFYLLGSPFFWLTIPFPSGAVPYLMLCALGYSVWPMHIANLQAINAQGRSDLYLRLEIIKKILGMLVLLLSVRFGIFWMIALKSLMDFVCTVINAWPNRKLLGYGPLLQWKDVLPEFFAAAGMGAVVCCLPVWLPLQILAGILLYWGLSALLHFESYRYLISSLGRFCRQKKGGSP